MDIVPKVAVEIARQVVPGEIHQAPLIAVNFVRTLFCEYSRLTSKCELSCVSLVSRFYGFSLCHWYCSVSTSWRHDDLQDYFAALVPEQDESQEE